MTAPLTFIPGWGSKASVWAPLIDHLRAGHTVRLLDLPGLGDMPAASDATLTCWADALASRFDGPAVLCGWSLGAMLALQLAVRHPPLVAALILIAPTPRFVAGADWSHGLGQSTVDQFRRGFENDPAATLRRFAALQVMGDAHRRTVGRELEATRMTHTRDSNNALADGLRVLADSDLRADVIALDVPLRLLHGDNDALMPVGAAEWLADNVPGARLSVFKGCGHAPLLSRPLECASLIESFLDD